MCLIRMNFHFILFLALVNNVCFLEKNVHLNYGAFWTLISYILN